MIEQKKTAENICNPEEIWVEEYYEEDHWKDARWTRSFDPSEDLVGYIRKDLVLEYIDTVVREEGVDFFMWIRDEKVRDIFERMDRERGNQERER